MAGIKSHIGGFTLIEIVMIIVVLGLLAALLFPSFIGVSESSRKTATRHELETLKRAIVGNPSAVVGGRFVDPGFEGDIGHPPASLIDLGKKSYKRHALDWKPKMAETLNECATSGSFQTFTALQDVPKLNGFGHRRKRSILASSDVFVFSRQSAYESGAG